MSNDKDIQARVMSVGVAYFDNPESESLTGGWYSINGEEAKTFSDSATLNPQVLWITNLNFSDYFQNRFGGTNHIKNSSYFRMALKVIGQDIGVYDDTMIPEMVEKLSGVCYRTIRLVSESMPGLRLQGFSLYEAIYAWLGLDDIRMDSGAHYQRELQSAFQEHSVVTARRRYSSANDSEIVRFVPNRVSHAGTVLSYPIPAGNIRYLPGPMSVDDFIRLDNPGFAEIVVDNNSAVNPGLLAFGAQYTSTGIMREWSAQPEVYFMREMGTKFTISNVLTYTDQAKAPQLPDRLTSNSLVCNSYSAGVLADNFLYALLCKRRKPGKSGQSFFPSRSVYLRSVDRMISYAMANVLSGKGVQVTSYGLGVINARVTEEELEDSINIAAECGFYMLSTASGRFQRD